MREDAFLHEIAERPEDDDARLIYADWLEDHGEAAARAGFIRDQVALEKLDIADPQYPETLARSRRRGVLTGDRRRPWIDHIPDARVTFRRGLISGVEITARQWRSQPIDDWQSGIKADTRTDYRPDPATTKGLMEKLRREELWQRPQEGRN